MKFGTLFDDMDGSVGNLPDMGHPVPSHGLVSVGPTCYFPSSPSSSTAAGLSDASK